MTQSKQPDFESTVNIEELDLSGIMEDDTITIDFNDTYRTTTAYPLTDANGDITITGVNSGPFTISGTDTIDLDWLKDDNFTLDLNPTMWEDCMPDPQKLKKMCEQYPALEKAYENFKTVYSMVEQDWKGNHEDDNDIPF